MFDSDLIIKDGAFTEPTKLKGILSKRMNITYGRNVSGKSTIARAFREQQPDRQAIVYLVFPSFKNFISDIPDSGPFNVSTFTQLRLEERLIISMRNKTSL